MSALIARRGFRLNQPGLRKIAAAVREREYPLELLERFFREKVKDKDSHSRLDDGLLVTWVRDDFPRWLRRRKPPQRADAIEEILTPEKVRRTGKPVGCDL